MAAPRAKPAVRFRERSDLLDFLLEVATLTSETLELDELLANVLAASTYPLEAVQADRWVKANRSLKGDALKAAVDKQAWDDSVKALTVRAFEAVLRPNALAT